MESRTGLRPAAVALLVALASPAAGQQAPRDTVALTLQEAVALALSTSEEIATARTQRALADAQITQARAGAFPQITGNVVYNRTLASLFDNIQFGPEPEPGEEPGENPFANLPFGRENAWSATLQITQPLYTAGRVGTALAIARNVRAAADFQVEESQAEIALQVRQAYFQTVLADEMVDIAREAFELADATLRQVELFRQQGTAAEFDVLRARVERDNLEPGIIEAQNARRLAELNLKRLIHLPAEQPIEPVTALTPVISDVDRAELRASLNRRPALRALNEQVAAREGAVRIARADYLPSVGAAGNFTYQAFPTGLSPLDTDWRRDWSVAVQASVPLFNGFRTKGQVDQARAELRLAELQQAQVRQGLELELEAALGEFDAARARIEARRATVAQAERTLELAELRFRTGLATQLDISNARLLLQQARVNEAQSLFNYLNALARLERVSGGEVPLVQPRLPGGE
ncbi:MAG TPA: TolC family protein [Longimicrobiales bacterium]|nr:TolC family protein [Longimicrobiales bacterium]